jgi:hypothetical protein
VGWAIKRQKENIKTSFAFLYQMRFIADKKRTPPATPLRRRWTGGVLLNYGQSTGFNIIAHRYFKNW